MAVDPAGWFLHECAHALAFFEAGATKVTVRATGRDMAQAESNLPFPGEDLAVLAGITAAGPVADALWGRWARTGVWGVEALVRSVRDWGLESLTSDTHDFEGGDLDQLRSYVAATRQAGPYHPLPSLADVVERVAGFVLPLVKGANRSVCWGLGKALERGEVFRFGAAHELLDLTSGKGATAPRMTPTRAREIVARAHEIQAERGGYGSRRLQ